MPDNTPPGKEGKTSPQVNTPNIKEKKKDPEIKLPPYADLNFDALKDFFVPRCPSWQDDHNLMHYDKKESAGSKLFTYEKFPCLSIYRSISQFMCHRARKTPYNDFNEVQEKMIRISNFFLELNVMISFMDYLDDLYKSNPRARRGLLTDGILIQSKYYWATENPRVVTKFFTREDFEGKKKAFSEDDYDELRDYFEVNLDERRSYHSSENPDADSTLVWDFWGGCEMRIPDYVITEVVQDLKFVQLHVYEKNLSKVPEQMDYQGPAVGKGNIVTIIENPTNIAYAIQGTPAAYYLLPTGQVIQDLIQQFLSSQGKEYPLDKIFSLQKKINEVENSIEKVRSKLLNILTEVRKGEGQLPFPVTEEPAKHYPLTYARTVSPNDAREIAAALAKTNVHFGKSSRAIAQVIDLLQEWIQNNFVYTGKLNHKYAFFDTPQFKEVLQLLIELANSWNAGSVAMQAAQNEIEEILNRILKVTKNSVFDHIIYNLESIRQKEMKTRMLLEEGNYNVTRQVEEQRFMSHENIIDEADKYIFILQVPLYSPKIDLLTTTQLIREDRIDEIQCSSSS